MPKAAKFESGLTAKKTNFAYEFVRNEGKPSDAYKSAYNADKMSNEAIKVEAQRLLKDPNIALLIEKVRKESTKALGATIEYKKSRLIEIVNYGLEEEIIFQDDGEIRKRMVNPSVVVSAINQLNLMDGDHAATKAKLEVEDTTNRADYEKLEDFRRWATREEKKRVYYLVTVEGVKHMAAVDQVCAEREPKD